MTGGEIINEDLHHDKTIKEEVKRNKKRDLEFQDDKTSEEEKKAKEIRQLTEDDQYFKMTRLQKKKEEINVNKVNRQAAEYPEYHNTYKKKIRENLNTVEVLLYKYRCTLIVKSSEKHPCIFLCIKKV